VREDGRLHYRVIFRNAPMIGPLLAIDVLAPNASEARMVARDELENELEEDDPEDFEWLSTAKLEHCYKCGRLRELSLVHSCPTG
jgi:hypothetical protein